MCVPKPKIQKVEAPAVPPPPVETATKIEPASSRASTGLNSKRRGLRALMVERPGSGLNPSSPAVGLRL